MRGRRYCIMHRSGGFFCIILLFHFSCLWDGEGRMGMWLGASAEFFLLYI